MKVKSSVLYILLIVIMLFTITGCTRVYPTVLTIDGENVTIREFNYYFSTMKLQAEQNIAAEEIEMYWATEKDGKTTFEILKENAYNEMVAVRVAAKKAQAMGLNYTDEILKTAYNFKAQMTQSASSEQEFYEMTNTDSDTIYQIAKMLALRSAMLQQLVVNGEVDLTDNAFKTAFETKYLKAQHILFTTVDDSKNPLSSDVIATKKQKAEEVLQRVNAGEDFTALMNEFSEDPGSKSQPDGYVFTSGEMVSEFEDATRALEFGKTSGIVESSFGYHIIKRLPLSAVTDSAKYDEVKESIQGAILSNYLEKQIPKWKEEFTIVETKAPIEKITK